MSSSSTNTTTSSSPSNTFEYEVEDGYINIPNRSRSSTNTSTCSNKSDYQTFGDFLKQNEYSSAEMKRRNYKNYHAHSFGDSQKTRYPDWD